MLIFKLKGQLREFTENLKEKENEIDHLKRHIRSTKLEEIEKENEILYQE
jgi:hypothetical protein